jgi:hypothetical protein
LFGLFFCRDLPNNRFEYVVDFVKFRLLPRRWELAAQHPPPLSSSSFFIYTRGGMAWPSREPRPNENKKHKKKERWEIVDIVYISSVSIVVTYGSVDVAIIEDPGRAR